MSERIAELRERDWAREVLDGSRSQPVLVDFWAEWCASCRIMAPTVEALAEEFAGRVRFGKLDIDESPETAERYDIRGVPTLVLFEGGEPKGRVVGVTSREDLANWIAERIGSASPAA